MGWENAGGAVRKPRDFNIHPSGKWLILANQNADIVIVFARDGASGKLTVADSVPVPAGTAPCFVGII